MMVVVKKSCAAVAVAVTIALLLTSVQSVSYVAVGNNTRSIQQIWTDAILSVANNEHTLEITVAVASDIVVHESNSITMPSFGSDFNITLDIYCTKTDSRCDVTLYSNLFLRIAPASNSPLNDSDASRLIVRMTGFSFNDAVLQVDNMAAIDIYLSHISVVGHRLTISPVFVHYAMHTPDTIVSLNAVSLVSATAPIHVINGGQIFMSDIFISACSGDTLIALDAISQYRLTDIVITDNDADFHSLISIAMAPAPFATNSDANIATNLYIDNNTLSSDNSGVIYIISSYAYSDLLHNLSIRRTSASRGVYVSGLNALYVGNTTSMLGVSISDTLHVAIANSSVSMATSGALTIDAAQTVFIDHCRFTDNTANGNIGVVSTLNCAQIRITNCHFFNNKAAKSGGALFVQSGDVSISQCIFEQNQAFSGGAVSVTVEAFIVINESVFADNLAFEGGAIVFESSIYELNNNSFVRNRAKTRGGALLDANARFGCELNQSSIVRQRNRFIGNAASNGGAIYSTNCKLTITQSEFDGNTAVIMGGALMFDISDVSVANSLILVSHSVLTNNSCILQGGGAMMISGGNVRVEYNILQHNRVLDARGIGGAVLVQLLDALAIDKQTTENNADAQSFTMYDCVVAHNQAYNGGGVAVQILNGNRYEAAILRTTIRDNIASNCGAGIYIVDGAVRINESIVAANIAQVCGGALVLEQGSLESYQSKYVNNTAHEYGGAIVSRSEHFFFDKDAIYNNRALQFGAGVVLSQCPSQPSRNLSVYDNTAAISGGGYFLQDLTEPICEWSTFQVLADNTAAFGQNFATFPERVQFEWQVPSQFTRKDVLSVRAVLLDAFNQTISALADTDQFIMQLSHNTTTDVYNLQWVGSHVTAFDGDDNGQTGITFKMVPHNYDDVWLEHEQIAHQTALMFTASIVLNQQSWYDSVSAVYRSDIYSLPTWTQIVAHVCAVICVLCIIASVVGIRKWSAEPIVKGSRVPFMYIILVGLSFLSVNASYGVFDHHRGGCAVYVWLMVIGLYLTMVSITAKTWAIYLVFAYAENLKEFQWTTKKLGLTFVAAPMVVVLIYLSAWTAVDEGMIYAKYYYDPYTHTMVGFCAYNPSLSGVFFLFMILAILFLCFLALRARHVPYNFNEAKYLGLCIFTIFLCFCVFVAVLYFDFIDPTTGYILRTISAFILIQSVLASLFYVKFWIVVYGGKVEETALENDGDHNAIISQLEPTRTSMLVTPGASVSHLKSASMSKWLRTVTTPKREEENVGVQSMPPDSTDALGLKLNTSMHEYQKVIAVTTPVSPHSPDSPVDVADNEEHENDNNNEQDADFVELQPLHEAESINKENDYGEHDP